MENFTRMKKLGKGNHGDVILVERKNDSQLFAIKRVELQLEENQKFDPQNEVKVLQTLDHPNIIRYFDAFIHKQKRLCILMEFFSIFISKEDLAIKIKEKKSIGPTNYFEESQIINWFAQLCLAISYLHSKKIIHRDIKVQNVFLSKEGTIKLGDFSISRILENTTELAQTSIGTPFYLSPEICQSKHYNHKIDIWMLGCTLHELCSFEKPFAGDSINAVVQNIINNSPQIIPTHYSAFIYRMLEQMLDKNPDNRPEASDLLQIPQIQIELRKIQTFYRSINLKLPIEQQVKPKYLMTEPLQEEERRDDIAADAKKLERTPQGKERDKKQKLSQNSIHYLIEQAKQQQQSPISSKRSTQRTPSHKQTNHKPSIDMSKESTPTPFAGSHVQSSEQSFSQSKLPSAVLSQQNSPHFQHIDLQFNQQFILGLNNVFFKRSLHIDEDVAYQGSISSRQPEKSLSTVGEEDQLGDVQTLKQKTYQRAISINTQLEGNYAKKESIEFQNSEIIGEQQVKTLVRSKQSQFAFADTIFNPNAPTSPNRTILFSDFLRRKLGEERFLKMKRVLEEDPDPLRLLDEKKVQIAEILGEQNMDCVRIFKILISSSVTPPGSHFRTKSAQGFELQSRTFQVQSVGKKSQPVILTEPISETKEQENQDLDPIQEILKDVEDTTMPENKIGPLGQNPWFEISFKNFQNYQDEALKNFDK